MLVDQEKKVCWCCGIIYKGNMDAGVLSARTVKASGRQTDGVIS